MATLETRLRELSREGRLGDRLPDGSVRCWACGHECLIKEGRCGVCRVRRVEGGRLLVPYGYVGALQVDPVEKKPFFHVLPGARALSFGMLGCDYRCAYCQNWLTSQALRDPAAVAPVEETTPAELAATARRAGAPLVVSTYNEPLITSEWSLDVFAAAREAGLRCAYVSNGNGTRRVLEALRPLVDCYKVDLKGFDDGRYRRIMGGVLANVLRTLEDLLALGFWVEVVTLVVPGVNDSDAELGGIARFLAGLSKDVPWHVTAFHKDYKLTDPADTSAETLFRAAALGREAGLRYVYAGNLPGEVGDLEDTRCPGCGKTLVERRGYRVLADRVTEGRCPGCGSRVPGRWDEATWPPDPPAHSSRVTGP